MEYVRYVLYVCTCIVAAGAAGCETKWSDAAVAALLPLLASAAVASDAVIGVAFRVVSTARGLRRAPCELYIDLKLAEGL